MGKRIKSFEHAVELEQKAFARFCKHMRNAFRAYSDWQKAGKAAERWGKKKLEREEKEARFAETIASELVNKEVSDLVMNRINSGGWKR